MENTWTRLKRVLERDFDGLRSGSLRPGASEAEIQEAEAAMGCRLPDDLREAYRHHDGVQVDFNAVDYSPRVPRLILPFFDWAPLATVLWHWREQRRLEQLSLAYYDHMPRIAPTDEVLGGAWMPGGWIPVGDAHMRVFAAVDLHPGPAGRLGQLIQVDIEDTSTSVMAPSFGDYMRRMVDAIESRAIVVHDNVWVDPHTGTRVMSLDEVEVRR